MLRMQATSNIILKDIQQLLKIETVIKHRALSPVKIRDDLIAPLTRIRVIKEIDALLKTLDEAVIQFKYKNFSMISTLITIQKFFEVFHFSVNFFMISVFFYCE